MTAMHSDNPAIQRIADDVSGIRVKQTVMEGQHLLLKKDVEYLKTDFDEKHEENKENTKEFKADLKEIKGALVTVNTKLAIWSAGSGVVLAIVMKLIEKWVKI